MIEIFEASGGLPLTNYHWLQHFCTGRITTKADSDAFLRLFGSGDGGSGQRSIWLHPIEQCSFIKIETIFSCISFHRYKLSKIK